MTFSISCFVKNWLQSITRRKLLNMILEMIISNLIIISLSFLKMSICIFVRSLVETRTLRTPFFWQRQIALRSPMTRAFFLDFAQARDSERKLKWTEPSKRLYDSVGERTLHRSDVSFYCQLYLKKVERIIGEVSPLLQTPQLKTINYLKSSKCFLIKCFLIFARGSIFNAWLNNLP